MSAPRFIVDVGARQVFRSSERDGRISSIEAALQSGGGSSELTNIVAKMREAAREAESRGRERLVNAREEVRAEGYPEQDDDVEYLLEDATGLGRGVYTALKGALLDRLRVVREVAGVCWAEMDKMITDHSRLRPMAISDVEAQRRFVIGRFLKARQDIINKYQSYLRNLKWLQLASSRQRRGCLTPKQNNILRVWLFSNFQNPYPEPAEKADLSRRTNLTATQINNWFINARVRVWKPTVELMTGERMRRETPAPPSPPRGGGDSGPEGGSRRHSVASGVSSGAIQADMNNQNLQLSRRRTSLPAISGPSTTDQTHVGHDFPYGGAGVGGILPNGANSYHRQTDTAANMQNGSHKGQMPSQPVFATPSQSQYQLQQNLNPNVSALKNTGAWSGAPPGATLPNAGEPALPRLPGSSHSNLPAIGGRSGRIEKHGGMRKRSTTAARDVGVGRLTGLSRGGIGSNYDARAMGDRPVTAHELTYTPHSQPAPQHAGLYQPYHQGAHPPPQQNPADPYARNRFQNQYPTQQNQHYCGDYPAGGNNSLISPQEQMHRVEGGAQYQQQYHQPTQHQQQANRNQHQAVDHARGYELMPPHHPGQPAQPLHPESYGPRAGQRSPPEHSYPQQQPFSQMMHHPAGQEEGCAPQTWGSVPGPPAPWPNSSSLDQFPAPRGGS